MPVVGHELDAHQAYLLLGVVGVVLEFLVGLLERGALGVAPVFEQFLLVVGLYLFINIVINI